MRIEWEIGLYAEHFERILKWYSLAFKDKHTTSSDEEVYNLIRVLHADLKRQDKEEQEEDGNI